ncbi:MAG: hypothetical protein OMM_05828 [Candidatus Magnetoglobus multicellularis str. Araruama]|uniref:Peptidase M6-like domain-containing protein n=1 Tax=Candidatus Magnetoglobus multicellularis str. Araruama TaxID=890399 RepID=A0A1V1NTW0_9BACT|nr:MAG: hypothetical protein OMM_05828 [Candidatus Magnetoglobus multicellularis str. Araruama]
MLWFYEDFQNHQTAWQIFNDSQYPDNPWNISSPTPLEQNRFAFVSYNRKDPYVDMSTPAISFLTHDIDLTHIASPVLSFDWKSPESSAFGEVYIKKMNGELQSLLGNRAFKNNVQWETRTIDLNTFAGRQISLIFKWVNQNVGQFFNTGFCVDNIAITGNYCDTPVENAPVLYPARKMSQQ